MNGFCLVTPASRGIGFALTRHLLQHTNAPVIATARRDCDAVREQLLQGLFTPNNSSNNKSKNLQVLPVDVTALTLPGVLHVEKSPSQIDAEGALHSFQVNTLGPMLLLKHLSPFLPTRSSSAPASALFQEVESVLPGHAVYALMAARLGSISDNRLGGWYSYRASKAGVFQLAKTLDVYLQARSGDRAMAVALHPGTVRTDFTRAFWPGETREMLEPDDAASRLLKVLCDLDVTEGRGRCWDWRGEEVVP